MSDGSPWRPLIHCKDIARAFIAFMKAPKDIVHNKPFNVGANQENYQVKDVADYVSELMPHASIVYTGEVGADPRNYRVSFDLLKNINFSLSYNLRSGMSELHKQYLEHNFSKNDFNGDQWVRLKTIKKHLHKLQIPQLT